MRKLGVIKSFKQKSNMILYCNLERFSVIWEIEKEPDISRYPFRILL